MALHDARFVGSGYPWVATKQITVHVCLQICGDVRRVCAGLLDLVSALVLLGALGHRTDCVHTAHHLLRVQPSPPHTWYVQSAVGIRICSNNCPSFLYSCSWPAFVCSSVPRASPLNEFTPL